jgi:hypothetical protein
MIPKGFEKILNMPKFFIPAKIGIPPADRGMRTRALFSGSGFPGAAAVYEIGKGGRRVSPMNPLAFFPPNLVGGENYEKRADSR